MNKRQKEVIQAQLDSEKAVLKQLERNYQDALADINTKIEILLARQDADMQHVIYQLEYQRALRTQVQSILEQLQANEFETVSEYLANSYNEGFLGAMYDMHGQGVPLIVPIDQEAVLEAVQHETKLSESLYTSLGHDMTELRKNISAEITRGIATGLSYGAIARNIEGYARVPMNRAMTIARTEAHRIQCKAAYDAQHKAQENGADVVKQWDAALDNHTRDTHRRLDGQIQDLDDPFEIGSLKAMYPGDFGDPAQDCNCRCSILQRARWNLGEEELNTLRERAEYFRLDKSEDLADFQKRYMRAQETLENIVEDANISDIDKKAIFDYMTAQSYVVNEKLRTGASLTNAEQAFIDNLDSALDKMPTYEGNLQRSLLFYSDEDVKNFIGRHTVGNRVTYNEYISTTKGETYNPEGQVQIYVQDAHSGRNISGLNDKEDEVLYPRGSSFIVVNVVEMDGKYYILMVEDNE